jgi:hypothetical protein
MSDPISKYNHSNCINGAQECKEKLNKPNGQDNFLMTDSKQKPSYMDLLNLLEEYENVISNLKYELKLKDEKIKKYEQDLKIDFLSNNFSNILGNNQPNDFNSHTTIHREENELKKLNPLNEFNRLKKTPSHSIIRKVNKNNESVESKFNYDNSISGYEGVSMISNSFLNEITINSKKNSIIYNNKKGLTDSTLNLKLNELEIEELYDNEMETFLEKIKNMKPEDDNKLLKTISAQSKNLDKENFTSFKSQEKENENGVNIENKGIRINQKKRTDFKKFLLQNEEKIKSTTREAKSKVKSYINESLIIENKQRSVSKVNQSKLNRSTIATSSNKKSLKLDETKIKIKNNLNSSVVKSNIVPIDKSLRLSSISKEGLKSKQDSDKKHLLSVPRNEHNKIPHSKSPNSEVQKTLKKDSSLVFTNKYSQNKYISDVSENINLKKEIKRSKNFPFKKKIENK